MCVCVCYVTSSTPGCLALPTCFHSTAAARGFIAMEINQGSKHLEGHVQVRGFSWRGVAGRRPLLSLPHRCPKETQVEGKIRTKKPIHKQATQGARTGDVNPSVKPSSLWRQEAARPARTHKCTHKVEGKKTTLKQYTLNASSTLIFPHLNTLNFKILSFRRAS